METIKNTSDYNNFEDIDFTNISDLSLNAPFLTDILGSRIDDFTDSEEETKI